MFQAQGKAARAPPSRGCQCGCKGRGTRTWGQAVQGLRGHDQEPAFPASWEACGRLGGGGLTLSAPFEAPALEVKSVNM